MVADADAELLAEGFLSEMSSDLAQAQHLARC